MQVGLALIQVGLPKSVTQAVWEHRENVLCNWKAQLKQEVLMAKLTSQPSSLQPLV